ncbi:putative amino acid transporter, transmembrane domain-containing protein [Helianthus annuus]|uniref:Amino acid transporter, transmembrane domain-containing protein n=1 Tax=Helianthus annuus TaxID=4232 RepID=A0A9K3I6M5_HELAN|nr:putative amino acid transporter, transmembrane domain-containing protein [Helianthus annuus]KAJ0525974.1 putative amino acid transporter, transmembrane domain-containing protein [Helianthus annuus]KAJ0534258.1 putative amino acid transporter, transmembrane domain-containing protein [Helianthus annuus]KAJ0542369.1 putative amino acid transporter, transmembrane domain-containing protein [Helianthus annuus]KAJ0707413.1 putative amino acid transporter, transmembrane domain-containing protein [He
MLRWKFKPRFLATPEKPSKGPMWKGLVVAYIVVAVCYFQVAIIGYWMFANKVSDNILISLHDATWLIIMANMYAMPVFDMIESVLVKKFNFAPSFKLRFITRNLYVGMCTALNKSRL